MIRYHGTPITPDGAALQILSTRHGMVRFERPDQVALVAEVCQSFVLDNGAFSVWKQGRKLDFGGYVSFVKEWCRHPGFDWCLAPDVIEGTERENDQLLADFDFRIDEGRRETIVPVWHLHESLDRLHKLVCNHRRVALGSSGEFARINSDAWRDRMDEALLYVSDSDGCPYGKLHGLRMMDPTVFSRYPFASVDSCNVARNIGLDGRWDNAIYGRNLSPGVRAQVIADRIERHACAVTFQPSEGFQNKFLFG